MMRSFIALLLLGGLLSAAEAGAQLPVGPDTDSVKTKKTAKRSNTADEEKTGNWEITQNVVIDAGKTVVLDSLFDYTTLDKVVVSLRTTSDSVGDLTNLTLVGYWATPEIDQYNATETKTGKQFPFTNTGGATFQVYGPQFRLALKNAGETTIKLMQVVVFCPLR